MADLTAVQAAQCRTELGLWKIRLMRRDFELYHFRKGKISQALSL